MSAKPLPLDEEREWHVDADNAWQAWSDAHDLGSANLPSAWLRMGTAKIATLDAIRAEVERVEREGA